MKYLILILAIVCFGFNSNSQNWTKVESNSKLRFNSISFGSELVGYIGADGGTLFKTTDGGENWNVILIDSTIAGIPMDIVEVEFQSSTHGYIVYNFSQSPVSHQGYSRFTRDGGLTWSQASVGMCGPLGVHMTDTANGYFFGAACFGGLTIDKIINRNFVNTTYKAWSNDFLRGMDFYSSSYGITAGDFGNVFRTVDAGVNWDTITTSVSQTFYDIKFVNDSLIYAVVDSGGRSILYSLDSGYTWQSYVFPSPFLDPSMKVISVSDNKTIYGAGQFNIVSKKPVVVWGSHSSGWNFYSPDHPNTGFNSVAFSDSVSAFAVGDSGIIYTNKKLFTSLDEINYSYNLSVFPNPASSFIQINSKKIKKVSLFSPNGTLVFEKSTQLANQLKINLPNLSNGLYLLKITHEDNSSQIKKIFLQQ